MRIRNRVRCVLERRRHGPCGLMGNRPALAGSLRYSLRERVAELASFAALSALKHRRQSQRTKRA